MLALDLSRRREFKLVTDEGGLEKEIDGVYICDLLSWVMANGKKDNIWITVQTHTNIIAVATLVELSCIVIPEGIEVESGTLEKANTEGVPIFCTEMTSYEAAKVLADMFNDKS